jgi:hypothetical protein
VPLCFGYNGTASPPQTICVHLRPSAVKIMVVCAGNPKCFHYA